MRIYIYIYIYGDFVGNEGNSIWKVLVILFWWEKGEQLFSYEERICYYYK